MPTKYVDVSGYATHYYYLGRTTLPDVVPDFSRGRALYSCTALDLTGTHGITNTSTLAFTIARLRLICPDMAARREWKDCARSKTTLHSRWRSSMPSSSIPRSS